jgi:hypothetical protein
MVFGLLHSPRPVLFALFGRCAACFLRKVRVGRTDFGVMQAFLACFAGQVLQGALERLQRFTDSGARRWWSGVLQINDLVV